ncbi:hypothetical protein [Nocardia sp. NPDC005366]|uniref:hypothetical protein n=1 Tax=Nocardia sp. NPDC005366 TaxID=3156878 RepID=UPI0033A90F38
MVTKAAQAFAVTAIAVSIGTLAAPAASAAPAPSTPVAGSVALCLNIPLPPFSISVCL